MMAFARTIGDAADDWRAFWCLELDTYSTGAHEVSRVAFARLPIKVDMPHNYAGAYKFKMHRFVI